MLSSKHFKTPSHIEMKQSGANYKIIDSPNYNTVILLSTRNIKLEKDTRCYVPSYFVYIMT